MSKATDTLLALAEFNSWRRGDETLEMPPPEEIGATIDDAVNLLRKYDETERELIQLKKKFNELDDELRKERITCLENRDAADADSAFLRRIFRGDHNLCIVAVSSWTDVKNGAVFLNRNAVEAHLRGHDALPPKPPTP